MVLPEFLRGPSHLSAPAWMLCTFSHRFVFFLQPQFFLQSMSRRNFQVVFMGSLYNSSRPSPWSPNILGAWVGKIFFIIIFLLPKCLRAEAMSFSFLIPLSCLEGSLMCSFKYWEDFSSYLMDLLGAPVNELEVDSRGIGVMSWEYLFKRESKQSKTSSQTFLFILWFCFYLLFGSGVSMRKAFMS